MLDLSFGQGLAFFSFIVAANKALVGANMNVQEQQIMKPSWWRGLGWEQVSIIGETHQTVA